MIFSGTQAPWSRPRRRVLVHVLGVRHQPDDLPGELAGVGGVVAERVVQRVEAAEVVDQLVGRAALTDSGADSQCADTTRIAFGLGSARAQSCSGVSQSGVSNGIGPPPWHR